MNRQTLVRKVPGARPGGRFSGIEECMSAKTIFAAALVVTVLGFRAAWGQTPTSGEGLQTPVSAPLTLTYEKPPVAGTGTELLPPPAPQDTPVPAGPAPLANGSVPPPAGTPLHHLSDWITRQRPECCGPVGANGPVKYELYFRAGPTLPVEGAIFGHVLETGWMAEVGGRSLFFNPHQDAAWAVDLGLSNHYNAGQRSDIHLPLSVLVPNQFGTATRVNFGVDPGVPGVTVSHYNRTFVNFGIGREWYLNAPADAAGTKWRAGIDAGARYGSAKLDLNELRHRTHVIYGAYAALHTDVEIPCCSWVFLAGFRVEWSYTWTEILQDQNNAEMEDVNILFTVGARF
jgi:hypothetical protein